jgi:CTP synthase
VPYLKAAQELKTKPTQQSVAKLREIGIAPHMLVCRTDHPLDLDLRDKLSMFCNVPVKAVIECRDVPHSIYELPLALQKEGMDQLVLDLFGLKNPTTGRRISGRKSSAGWCSPLTKSASVWSANTSSSRMPTSRSMSHSPMPASPTTAVSRSVSIDAEDLEKERWPRPAEGTRWHSGSGRIWRSRHGGQDRGGKVRARKQGALLRLCLGLQIAVIELREMCSS